MGLAEKKLCTKKQGGTLCLIMMPFPGKQMGKGIVVYRDFKRGEF
jgi:hypothetical protein